MTQQTANELAAKARTMGIAAHPVVLGNGTTGVYFLNIGSVWSAEGFEKVIASGRVR